MPSIKVSNPRDLIVQLLGELLFVERRLADCVLEQVADSVRDDDLRTALREHREETKQHVEHVEAAFRKLAVAPTSNLCRPFESAVSQHEELQSAFKEPRLGDVFHAQTALHTEHWEIAAYTAVISLAEAMGHDDVAKELRDPLKDEEHARDRLAKLLARLAQTACAR
jgi:ferritin-like metal-binding protein YciE